MAKFVFEIDPNEMVCRMLESVIGAKRPPGLPAAKAVSQVRAKDPDVVDSMFKAADAAARYMAECISTQTDQAKVQ